MANINLHTVNKAASSRFGLLELENEKVVCKTSFRGWAKHCLKYATSKDYRLSVQRMRANILKIANQAVEAAAPPPGTEPTTGPISVEEYKVGIRLLKVGSLQRNAENNTNNRRDFNTTIADLLQEADRFRSTTSQFPPSSDAKNQS